MFAKYFYSHCSFSMCYIFFYLFVNIYKWGGSNYLSYLFESQKITNTLKKIAYEIVLKGFIHTNNQIEIYKQAKSVFQDFYRFGLKNGFVFRNGFVFLGSILLIPSMLLSRKDLCFSLSGYLKVPVTIALSFCYFKKSLILIF